MDTKDTFLRSRTVIVFEHLVVSREVAQSITWLLANPLDSQRSTAVEGALRQLVQAKIDKYNTPELKQHIKLIYLFLTEGLQGMASGQTLADQEEVTIKAMFEAVPRPADFPVLQVIGISELRPILAQVEARVPGIRLAEFLLTQDGRGGYDTPKIAAALIQLARRAYARQEMFIRIDDDVQPTAAGLLELKATYCDLVHDSTNRAFCISWNYEVTPLDTLLSSSSGEPDYASLFRHFVNSYSIRTTFLGEPSSRCQYDPDTGRLLPLQPQDGPCHLSLVHTKYFIDLFRCGYWGSSLNEPISGAGMCFSPDALLELPPWCNADALVTWIDDFIKWQMMAIYFGKRFASDLGLLQSAGCPGFMQERNDPQKFTHGDVEWSTTTYLDRLVMGCMLSYCIEPARYGQAQAGFGELLREHDHLTALRVWHGGMREALRDGATQHVRKVFQDWHQVFCAKAVVTTPGYLTALPPPPAGFVPAPANTFFNAYTLKQLLALDQGTFDLTPRVLQVLERYLAMKYRFWPHVVSTIDTLRARYARAGGSSMAPLPAVQAPTSWLFVGLDTLGPTMPRPTARCSQACLALIVDDPTAAEPRWLMQWNSKWQVMHFIAGHKETHDPSDLACMMRELHEELYQDLDTVTLAQMRAALGSSGDYEATTSPWTDPCLASVTRSAQPPHDFPEFTAFSRSTGVWSRYQLKIYQVRLTPEGRRRLFRPNPFLPVLPGSKPAGPNEWVFCRDIERGWTTMGHPISPTASWIVGEAWDLELFADDVWQ